jgi:hypothetical protein
VPSRILKYLSVEFAHSRNPNTITMVTNAVPRLLDSYIYGLYPCSNEQCKARGSNTQENF